MPPTMPPTIAPVWPWCGGGFEVEFGELFGAELGLGGDFVASCSLARDGNLEGSCLNTNQIL